MLEPLVEICDSLITYRRRYFSRPEWQGVIDLLLSAVLRPQQPPLCLLAVLRRESEHFPGDPAFGLFPRTSSR
jgi:uncharacterized alpha-E superfamily protein